MTETYEATLREFGRRIADRRVQNEDDRKTAEALKKQLQALLQRMRAATSAFDEEDCEHVQKQIADHDAHLEILIRASREEEAKRREREELFRCMLGAMNERTRILEQDDDCLSGHPEMLQYFARKQLILQRLLTAKMEESMVCPGG